MGSVGAACAFSLIAPCVPWATPSRGAGVAWVLRGVLMTLAIRRATLEGVGKVKRSMASRKRVSSVLSRRRGPGLVSLVVVSTGQVGQDSPLVA